MNAGETIAETLCKTQAKHLKGVQAHAGGVARQGGWPLDYTCVETPPWKVFVFIALGIPKGL